ncbi:hypothetical protein SAY87_006687 [Trapa incisa]|uniref:HIT-type domain-containing protein n=1 Tax=Trapa incisa TaxID=236973 RepID=A0AAN7Q4B4_9MYRT|nr:hypothetical protein SAY87_006687 [Trapa incisa]
MAPRQCQVCTEALSKYKCPSCYIPYCSLACFKRHKETPCIKITIPMENPMIGQEEFTRRTLSVEDPSEIIQHAQLKSVAASNEIRDALMDEDLQRLIFKIDSSEDAESELDKAMEGDTFRIFADKVLSTIDR